MTERRISACGAALAAAAMLTSVAMAQTAPVAVPVVERGPYDLAKLRGICGYVYDRTRTPAGSTYRYVFDQKLADAAGAQPGDYRETTRTRVRYLWLDNQSAFRCTASNFNLTNGNLLKYSVRSRSYNFVNVAIANWQLEFNFIDPVDHRTFLDYVRRDLEASAGNESEAALQDIYDAARDIAGEGTVSN